MVHAILGGKTAGVAGKLNQKLRVDLVVVNLESFVRTGTNPRALRLPFMNTKRVQSPFFSYLDFLCISTPAVVAREGNQRQGL